MHQCLINGSLDYFLASKLSKPSIDYPSHRGCMCTRMLKLATDARVLVKMNAVHSIVGTVELCKIPDSYARVLFSLFSYRTL